MSPRTATILVLLLVSGLARAEDPPGRRMLLLSDLETRAAEARVGVMQPFDVRLVAERDGEAPQISTVAFTLDIPDGLVLLGEEVLVESLVAIGTPRTGLNLAFHCKEQNQLPVFHFRLVATKPLENVELRLLPDTRTNFLGFVACRDEEFAMSHCEPVSFLVSAE